LIRKAGMAKDGAIIDWPVLKKVYSYGWLILIKVYSSF
jgi:hypothetical protein